MFFFLHKRGDFLVIYIERRHHLIKQGKSHVCVGTLAQATLSAEKKKGQKKFKKVDFFATKYAVPLLVQR